MEPDSSAHSRLAEYFAVIGYDFDKQRGGTSTGKILQSFPGDKEYEIAMFCQPLNWRLTNKPQPPTFFNFILTDEFGGHNYVGCFTFHESVSVQPIKADDEDIDDESLNSMEMSYMTGHHRNSIGSKGFGLPNTSNGNNNDNITSNNVSSSVSTTSQRSNALFQMMYAPKCIVMITRHNYPEIIKNCLTVIYTVYIDSLDARLEQLVTNLVAGIQIPGPGGQKCSFTLGAGDRHFLHPPLTSTIPVTSTAVYDIFQQLRIYGVVNVVIGLMTEHKVLIMSRSFSQIYNAAQALLSLLYPFVYSHVYIPILPACLIDFLHSPTPYLMGIHSSLKNQTNDLNDVIFVDLDEGSVKIPESLGLPTLEDRLHSQLINHLCLVLRPQLPQADNAFSTSQTKCSSPEMLDKEIRAIFLRTFTQLLQGYRSCLTVCRVYPKPIIAFNKTSFLSQRNYACNDFINRLLDSIYFSMFVQDRGIPFRRCDLFDDLYSTIHTNIKEEFRYPELVLKNIQDLAKKIYLNEMPTNDLPANKILQPTEGAFTRVHIPPFPSLDVNEIQELIDSERIKRDIPSIDKDLSPVKDEAFEPRPVPEGLQMSAFNELIGHQSIQLSSARKEVMRKCIKCIFENKILDARKTLNAVIRSMRTKQARLALCEELSKYAEGNKAVLEQQPFDLVVRLLNCALQDNNPNDVNEIAAAILPLARMFCRKLSTNIYQHAYTCIQDHPVWSNQQFWIQSFYSDVETALKDLYQKNGYESVSKKDDASGLEVAANQMRSFETIEQSQINCFIEEENSTIMARAIDYALTITCMRIPFDISGRSQSLKHSDFDTHSISGFTNTTIEDGTNGSLINDNESGFEDSENLASDVASSVIKFISRFVDKVFTDSGVREDYNKRLQSLDIPKIVGMHIETVEQVFKESKNLPPPEKPKILLPRTLPGEEILSKELRAYLINDGKEECRVGVSAGTQFLPAEGAIFMTNYRIIFKGRPVDSYASQSIVIRSFPVATLIKDKRVNITPIASLEHYLPEGVQLKSDTFQLMKIAFDEEVAAEMINNFLKALNHARAPQTIFEHFAFTSQYGVYPRFQKVKDKKTLHNRAKKTLLRTAERVGYKTAKPQKYKNKYNYRDNLYSMTMTPHSPSQASKYYTEDLKNCDHDSIASSMDNINQIGHGSSHDQRPVHRLHEMLYCQDYERLGFDVYSNFYTVSVSGVKPSRYGNSYFRINSVNIDYSVCSSYPGLVVSPFNANDEALKKLSKCYRNGRFPAITWKHPRTRALILRSGSFNPPPIRHLHSSYETSQIENDKYLRSIVTYTLQNRNSFNRMSDMETVSISSNSVNSPEANRKNFQNSPVSSALFVKQSSTFQRAVNTIRTSGGKSTIGATMGKQLQKLSNNAVMLGKKELRKNSFNSTSMSTPSKKNSFTASDSTPTEVGVTSVSSSISSISYSVNAPLFIITEKKHQKPVDASYEFIPIDVHEVRNVKQSFKNLLKICVPSEPKHSDVTIGSTFLRDFAGTEWLKQIQKIMEIAQLIVDLVDRGSSVMLSLENGYDIVPQALSVAQICLDPYYRTFEGFRTLIEKEWLTFGHRFVYRSNLVATSTSSGFAPIFLQFLDIVHQIHSQFPLSFEFNQYFIKFVAYHYVSCRFRTFLQDSEIDRSECGWIEKDIQSNAVWKKLMTQEEDDEETISDEKLASQSSLGVKMPMNSTGTSFWDYCVRIWVRSPIFYNFYYVPIITLKGDYNDAALIRPNFSMATLRIWDYFVGEELAQGPSYDLEVVQLERDDNQTDDFEKWDTKRTVVNAIYDSVEHSMMNCFHQMLDQINLLEAELDYPCRKWLKIWNKIEVPTQDIETMFKDQQQRHRIRHKISKDPSQETDMMASYSFSMANSNQILRSRSIVPHNFEAFVPAPITKCDQCSLLIGVKQAFRCSECELCCHDHCRDSVDRTGCRKKSATLKANQNKIINNVPTGNDELGHDVRSDSESESEFTKTGTIIYGSPSRTYRRENLNFKGYLLKQGQMFGRWKQRWYELDTNQHRLKYFDTDTDRTSKGHIDLSEVVEVVASPYQKNTFELRCSKRAYIFSTSGQPAQEWIDRLSACLQN